MVKIKLITDVAEGNIPFKDALVTQRKQAKIKTVRLRGGRVLVFAEGAILDMHESSAQKYIARKLGVVATDEDIKADAERTAKLLAKLAEAAKKPKTA